MKNRISACLVIYNEEKIIEQALKSIKGFVGEIIVVHDGPCSDNSLKICQKYGAKIFVQPHVGEAEPHRAFSYEKAKYNWILQVDADEYLSKGLQKNLQKLVQDQTVSCYEFVWPYWNGKKYLTKTWPTKKALFRKDKITFAAVPHSEVIVDGITKKVNLRLEHQPNYDNFTLKTFRTKWVRWTKVHAKYLLKDPQTIVTFPKGKQVALPKYYFIVKHPYLLSFPLGIYQGFQSVKTNGLKAGWLGIKVGLMIGMYYVLLAIEVGHQKHLDQILADTNF